MFCFLCTGSLQQPFEKSEKLIHENFAHAYITIGNSYLIIKKQCELKVLRIYTGKEMKYTPGE